MYKMFANLIMTLGVAGMIIFFVLLTASMLSGCDIEYQQERSARSVCDDEYALCVFCSESADSTDEYLGRLGHCNYAYEICLEHSYTGWGSYCWK